MGLYDRDYATDYREPGIHLQAPQSMTIKLVLITVGAYLGQVFYPALTDFLCLPSFWYREPWQFYRLLTYGFQHDTRGIEHIFFNMLVLWVFGREVEWKYGQREYLSFYLTAIVIAGLVWSVGEQAAGGVSVMVGASGAISGLAALYALNFPHRQVLFMFFIPMPMWVAGLIMVGMDAYGAVSRTSNIACSAHLAGAMFGLIYYRTGWSAARFVGRFLGKLPKPNRPKLRVHEPEEVEDATDSKVDLILKKIQEQGQDSLTWKERRTLEQASREYQNRRRP